MQFHILVVPCETGISAKFLGYYLSSHWKVELPHITSPDIGFRQLRLNQSTIISSLSFSFLLQFFSHTFIFLWWLSLDSDNCSTFTFFQYSAFSWSQKKVTWPSKQYKSLIVFLIFAACWKYLEKENVFLEEKKKFWFLLWMRRNGKKIFGEGKYISCGGKEKRRRKRKRRKS